jgi:O-antigen/teichoic acid export membrane protein
VTDTKLQIEDEPGRYEDAVFPEDVPGGVSAASENAPNEGVIRSVGVNTFYQVGSQIAPAIAAILAIPFLLRHFGPEAFGIVTLFSTALIYFTMLDLGLGRAATRFIAQSLEGGHADDVRRYFWGSIFLLTCVGVLVSIGCELAIPTVVSHYLKIPPAYNHAAILSFYLICGAIPMVTLTATLRGMLEAWGKFPFISLVSAGNGIGLYLLPVVAVLLGGGLISVAATYVLVRIGMGVALAIGCLRIEGRSSLKPILDTEAVKKMLSFGGWLSVSNIIGCAILYGDRFLLGSSIGMAAVASYAVPMDVISRMQILVSSFCAVLFPLMSRLDQSKSSHFRTVYRGALAIGLALMTPLTIAIVVLAPILMRIWLRNRNTPEAVFAAQVFLAGAVVQATASIAFTALHARGRSDMAAWMHMVEFPIYCVAFYWAAVHFGVRGAALAWLGRVIVDFIGMVILLRLHKKEKGSFVQPELLAALISVSILFTIGLSGRIEAIVACIVCILTWWWTWRTLVDQEMRAPMARVLFGSRQR